MDGGRLAARILAIALALVMVAAPAAFAVGTPTPAKAVQQAQVSPEEKIAPDLRGGQYSLLDGFPSSIAGGLEAAASARGLKLYWSPGPLARVAVYYTGGDRALEQIRDSVYRVTSVLRGGSLSVAFALASSSQVEKLASLPFVVRVERQASLLDQLAYYSPARVEGAPAGGVGVSGEAFRVAQNLGFPIYSAPKLLGAERVWEEFGINGSGVKVAVVDTGVDLGSPDLGPGKVAMDSDGTPLTFDADEVGLVLMNPTVRVSSDKIYIPGWLNGYIWEFFGSSGGVYLDYATWALAYNNLTGNIYYEEIPVVNQTYTIPSSIQGNVTFGLAVQFFIADYRLYGIPFKGFMFYGAPVILADSNGDGAFDTVYVDTSTAYYLLMTVLSEATNGTIPAPNSSLADLSFADEQPLTYGGDVVANRDFTGDGVPDFSLGALAGAVYDYYGLFANTSNLDWWSDWEPGALLLPGYDSLYGLWVDFIFDFHGHGTSCAHVIGATGETPREVPGTAPGVEFNTTMPGIAPGAKIGGAPALWNGDVVTAQLWLAGFDLVDPETYTWVYTGNHQADVISNSWGSSWLLVNGYASDADPTSLWEDYITAVSGTVIVHAAGNGGPGFGSVTMPGAAAFVITAGAATDFYYRPVYGIGNASYIPGGYGQVVSWSDRGPTEFGYPKPDIVNIGSFEWAGTRAIDAPFDGSMAYDLFGGTSEATPMTAGSVALIIQALRQAGIDYTPYFVKAVLKSSAEDEGFNPFSQGSGFVNVYKAVETVLEGGLVAYSEDSAYNILEQIDETMAAMLRTDLASVWQAFQGASDTALYTGPMVPGEEKTLKLYIEGLQGAAANATIYDYALHKSYRQTLALALLTGQARLVYSDSSGAVVSEPASGLLWGGGDGKLYINVSAVGSGYRIAIPLSDEVLKHKFTVISLAAPAEYYFLPGQDGRPDVTSPAMLYIWELGVWFDLNGNGVIDAYNNTYYEVARLGYDFRGGPVAHLELGNPMEAVEKAAEAVANYTGFDVSYLLSHAHLVVELRVFANAWSGSGAPPMPVSGGVDYYDEADCMLVSAPSQVSVSGEAEVNVTISVPSGMPPGVYEAYLVVESSYGEILVPVSVVVAKPFDPASEYLTFIGGASQGFVYDNYAYRPALDQFWRPEVGDWRVYPIAIPAESAMLASGVQVTITWANPNADYDASLVGPGVNYWGVVAPAFASYTDAAVLGGKQTYPYAVGGVYSYFDYPAPGIAQFTAPLDPLRPLRGAAAGEGYVYYWLVVHQKFSDVEGEKPLVMIQASKFITPNTVSVQAGSQGVAAAFYLSANTGPAYIVDYIVVPLSGSGLQAAPLSQYLGSSSLRVYQVYYDASQASQGSYLLVNLVVEPDTPAVILGYTDSTGATVAYPVVPLIYPAVIAFNVG